MKSFVFIGLFLLCSGFEVGHSAQDLETFFYQEIGCTKKEGKTLQYDCPDFSLKNDTCRFKDKVLNFGERVDKEHLKGSCNADCHCGYDGRINCAHYDCFERLKSGCSHFKYSLDGCCPVDSVCGPIAKCEVDGKTYQEGETIYRKDICEVCVCDVDFKPEAPFCRRRKCYDQANHQDEIASNGAPAFFEGATCCPSIWTTDEGENIVKINADAPESDLFCKYGQKKVKLGYGFKKSVKPYGRDVPLKCECSIPPFVICKEELK